MEKKCTRGASGSDKKMIEEFVSWPSLLYFI